VPYFNRIIQNEKGRTTHADKVDGKGGGKLVLETCIHAGLPTSSSGGMNLLLLFFWHFALHELSCRKKSAGAAARYWAERTKSLSGRREGTLRQS